MKEPKVSQKNRPRNEGCTQTELAAEVRRRAFELYEQQGRVDGHALEHWAQAEAEILPEKRRAAVA
ncbi:MAG TPA: DUF2934 domain-containing protein [Terriglobales bacterium]|nr:DUF2934 domain-containing protein [Terriglobales bacterium]